MAKHLPDYHSPLLALGKKVLLLDYRASCPSCNWSIRYRWFDTTRPPTEAEKRSIQEAKIRAARLKSLYAPTIQHAEALKASLAGKDDVATLQEHIKKIFELSGEMLEGEELKRVQGMTPEQLVEYKQKKLDDLKTDRQRGAYALWVQAEAQKKLTTVPAAVAATCDDNNLIPGHKARLVKDGDNYKIVLAGLAMPAGSVVVDKDGRVVATGCCKQHNRIPN